MGQRTPGSPPVCGGLCLASKRTPPTARNQRPAHAASSLVSGLRCWFRPGGQDERPVLLLEGALRGDLAAAHVYLGFFSTIVIRLPGKNGEGTPGVYQGPRKQARAQAPLFAPLIHLPKETHAGTKKSQTAKGSEGFMSSSWKSVRIPGETQ